MTYNHLSATANFASDRRRSWALFLWYLPMASRGRQLTKKKKKKKKKENKSPLLLKWGTCNHNTEKGQAYAAINDKRHETKQDQLP